MSKLLKLEERIVMLEGDTFHLRCRIDALANILGYRFMYVPAKSSYWTLVKVESPATETKKKKEKK